ncbi:cationic peroxidase 1-like [Amborella trichopoda]|uniref:Plant heme peroxidase family profile domain-containing protein n=2 Tax=Amborella trichopoda TaxID=13333 RepID=U5DDH5_AMBTC|nr:cationic peroxidase 1 [Amborella trichopoda]XP_020521686.1 cationic peroxidase 1-like [Amborella trichopoda]ERN18463.1 hypothetical protein AMTR_s00711p00000040 [Amborella trichopoda]|eukprot:XP_006856996.3 cationic peroxidase 1 [Amborella trichopoda]
MASPHSLCTIFLLTLAFIACASGQLSPGFYNGVCPQALPTIQRIVRDAVRNEARMGASLLRLHFHDCFVNGCDGSILLDDTSTFTGEKTSRANANSARGFEVIDSIKTAVDQACGGSVVSCADILAVAARDSVYAVSGSWTNIALSTLIFARAITLKISLDSYTQIMGSSHPSLLD